MRSTSLLTLAAGAALLLAAPVPGVMPALAQMRTSTVVKHYAISGHSERALLADMRRRGPRVKGRPALASTRLSAQYSARLAGRPGICRVRDFRLRATFTMRLPVLRKPGALRRGAKRRWPGFAARLRRHERRHIAIWKGCLAQVDRELRRLSAATCGGLKQRMRARYRRIMEACSRKHDAFDAREHHVARNLPFIRAAIRESRRGYQAPARTGRD